MNQEPKSIDKFSPGDIVTRIEPAAAVNSSFFGVGLDYDSSYIGEKLIFMGTANGCAYFEPTGAKGLLFGDEHLISLPIHKFGEGWAHYIDPLTMRDAKPKSKYSSMSLKSLTESLENAIESENYEEASRIRHELDVRDEEEK